MTSPSDLLKKANTTEYVIHTQAGGQLYKNPAYYMQPPTANASIWTGSPPKTPWGAGGAPTAKPQAPAYAPPNYSQPTPPPYTQSMPPAYSQPTPPAYAQSAPTAPPPPEEKPMRAADGGTITIRPPEIPRQYIPRQPTIYTDLMKKHDRFGQRHLKG